MRHKKEIENEAEALKKLRPIGPHAKATQAKIDYAVEELLYGMDDTAEEWNDLTSSEQDIVRASRDWKEGLSKDRPSEGWGQLVEAQ